LTDVLVRSTSDSQVIFEAVAQKLLPLITKRLTPIERRDLIRPGSVFVWEERGPESGSSGARIERWTDGKQWGPSRVRDEFLVYTERVSDDDMGTSPQDQLIKQTCSVWAPTSRETRKWHLVAYLTTRSVEWLGTIDHIPNLAWLKGVPRLPFRPVRTTKGKICDEIHRIILRKVPSRTDSWQSPRSSPPSGDERLPNIGLAVPSAPWRVPKSDRRLGVEFTDHRETTRELAPLVYLQSISAPPRQPLDDFAIRSFDSNIGK